MARSSHPPSALRPGYVLRRERLDWQGKWWLWRPISWISRGVSVSRSMPEALLPLRRARGSPDRLRGRGRTRAELRRVVPRGYRLGELKSAKPASRSPVRRGVCVAQGGGQQVEVDSPSAVALRVLKRDSRDLPAGRVSAHPRPRSPGRGREVPSATCRRARSSPSTPATGDVLAMVSHPAYDPNVFAQRHQRQRRVAHAPDHRPRRTRSTNRAIAGAVSRRARPSR